jgi:hypothetical protein
MSIKSGMDWLKRYEKTTGKQHQLARKIQKDGLSKIQGVKGAETVVFGNDPNTRYDMEFRVVSLDDLIPSNTLKGGVNPDYDDALQPRDRSRAASQAQIDNVAKNLSPEALLLDFHQLDKGTPIIGEDMMVESGNGRTLALLKARGQYGQKFDEYTDALRKMAEDYGIDPDQLKNVKDPVLVRVRTSDVDRARFAQEANQASVLQMSPIEKAAGDAGKIELDWLNNLDIREGQSIDKALRMKANEPFVRSFIGSIPKNDRGNLLRKDGSLNRMGLWRTKAAIFAKVFPGEAGTRLADTFFESLDSSIKNFENAIGDAMPMLAQAEGLIRSGRRPRVSLANDISKAIDMLARLKEQGMSVSDYTGQMSLFQRETTPTQERLMQAFDGMTRSRKQIRESLTRYANAVIEGKETGQSTMFGGMELDKDTVIEQMLEGVYE